MAHLLTGGEKCGDLIHDDDYRSPLGAYRFGRTHAKSVRGRTALSRINGYIRNMIEAIADAKLRRMQQSLVSRAPQGSADAFWRLNRRRMVAWTVLCGDAQLFMIAVAAVVSTFWPDALVAALWLSAAAGNALLGILLLIGWKNTKSRG